MLKEFFTKAKNKYITYKSEQRFTCDFCRKEVFCKERLCEDCKKNLKKDWEKTCPVCGRSIRSEGICLTCKSDRPLFKKAFSPYDYVFMSGLAVNRLKNGEAYLADFLGEEMAKCYLTGGGDRDVLITCVPTTKEKQRERGYNQAELLGRVVAKILSKDLEKDILIKEKEVPEQKHLSAIERKENIKGVYRVHERSKVNGKNVLLIDDILTTGATGNECARILKNAGAKDVYLLTAASTRE